MITEGYMPFGEFKTYYRIVGDIQESYRKGMAPLVLMHGGPAPRTTISRCSTAWPKKVGRW